MVPSILELCAGLPEREFEEGEFLLREGESSKSELFVLIEGSLEILKGEDVSISVITDPGAVIGEMSILLGIPISASVRACERTRCYVAADGDAFLRDHPETAFIIARLLARRLHLATTYLADIKRQFEGEDASLAMLDQVLETILNHHDHDDIEPGSDREREPNY